MRVNMEKLQLDVDAPHARLLLRIIGKVRMQVSKGSSDLSGREGS